MKNQKTTALPSIGMAVAAIGLSALVGFAAVYVTVGGSDNATPTVNGEKSTAKRSKVKSGGGDLAGFVAKTPAVDLPNISFEDGAGQPKRLADFRGKTVLLNLWATWCAPCKAEMPSLDRLQSKLGSDTFQVVALALDRKGTKAAQAFLDDTKARNLKLYIDPTAKAGTALKVMGMPTTILIDPEGREIGRLVGPAEWDSAAAIARIKRAIREAG